MLFAEYFSLHSTGPRGGIVRGQGELSAGTCRLHLRLLSAVWRSQAESLRITGGVASCNHQGYTIRGFLNDFLWFNTFFTTPLSVRRWYPLTTWMQMN